MYGTKFESIPAAFAKTVFVVVMTAPEGEVVFRVSFNLYGVPPKAGMSAPSINRNWTRGERFIILCKQIQCGYEIATSKSYSNFYLTLQ